MQEKLEFLKNNSGVASAIYFSEMEHLAIELSLIRSDTINNFSATKEFREVYTAFQNMTDLDSFRECRYIQDSISFGRMNEKTQVQSPQNGLAEVVKNRATHTHEVVGTAVSKASVVASRRGLTLNDVDYMRSIQPVALSHDIGHPPFGHDGATFVSRYFKACGIKEGFDDNNNNLVVIEKNKIVLRDYTLASIIKYPKKLYESQKDKYLPILENALKMDVDYFASIGIHLKDQKRTICCEIMDAADEDAYSTSDLADFLCIGNQLEPSKVMELAEQFNVKNNIRDLLEVSRDGTKSEIKRYFSDFKESFTFNHALTDEGLVFLDPELQRTRQLFNKISRNFYINPLREMDFHKENMAKLKLFINEVVNNGFHPSTHYKEKIENAANKNDRLVALRDMICEVSDWYVINMCKEFDIEKTKNMDSSFGLNS